MGITGQNPALPLRANEFACLRHQSTLLYTEIIQVVETRQRYWARPVLLCEVGLGIREGSETVQTIYDVRSGPDLLWPQSLFQCVFDTELVPLLAHLTPEGSTEDSFKQWTQRLTLARQKLHQFTQQLWQSYPLAFQDIDG